MTKPQTTEELPTVTHSGSFTIFGVELKCHRLSNGQAIIEADDMERLFEVMGMEGAPTLDHEELLKFQKFQRGQDV